MSKPDYYYEGIKIFIIDIISIIVIGCFFAFILIKIFSSCI